MPHFIFKDTVKTGETEHFAHWQTEMKSEGIIIKLQSIARAHCSAGLHVIKDILSVI